MAQTIVVKIGGSIADRPEELAADIAKLSGRYRFVVVHGGAMQTTALSERMGVEPKFITSPSGVKSRYTDKAGIEAYTLAVRGKVNSGLVLALHAKGVHAAGISGIDGGLLRAKQKIVTSVDASGKQVIIRDDYTGKIDSVDARALKRLLDAGFTPVVAPLALGESNQPLNTDGDRAAAAIASAIGARALLLMTDVDGYFLNFPNDLAPKLERAEIDNAIKSATGGMKRKLMACSEAIDGGVPEAIIGNGTITAPISNALSGKGTHMHNPSAQKHATNFSLCEAESALEMPVYRKRELSLSHGKGSLAWDVEGNEYVDFAVGIGVAILGHAHPGLCSALSEQAGNIITCSESFGNVQRAWLLERLAERWNAASGKNAKIFLSNSGTEANEAAIKLARAKTGRKGMVSAMNAFHGRSCGSLALTYKPKYRERFEPLIGPVTRVRFNDIEGLKAAVTADTASVFLEVIQGEGGIRPAKEEYLKAARDICTDKGAVLVFDEVQAGMGRTGKFFSFEHYGVSPDVATLAKGLGGGVPIGATIASEEFSVFKNLDHGSTFGGNPFACAAANAVLDAIDEENLLERATENGAWFMNELDKLKAKHPSIVEVRGKGLFIGMELNTDVTPLLRAAQPKGLIILSAGDTVLRMLPPLNTPREIYERVLPILDSVLP
jgi:acetylglutamate kinase